MSGTNITELIVFIVYLLCMIGIGVVFFFRTKNGGEKDYFLGGRKMGAWVSALSAGASDMSAWVLMGLPASVYALGLGQVWIAVGLAIGYALSWLFEAPRLPSVLNKTFQVQILFPAGCLRRDLHDRLHDLRGVERQGGRYPVPYGAGCE